MPPYQPYSTFMPYNTYGFNPAQSMYSMPQAPVNNPVQPQIPEQPVQQRKTNCEWIFVNGLNNVKEHIVQPNQTLYFLDNNDPVLYQKTADEMGSCKIKAFRMIDIDINNISPESEKSVMPSVTKEELTALSDRISQLESQLKGVMKANESVNFKQLRQSDYQFDQCAEKWQSSATGTEYPVKQSAGTDVYAADAK